MKCSELRKGTVLTVASTGEQWRLGSQRCFYRVMDGDKDWCGKLKVGEIIPVDNHRRNKWMAKRLSDSAETILCFDPNAEDITVNLKGEKCWTV